MLGRCHSEVTLGLLSFERILVFPVNNNDRVELGYPSGSIIEWIASNDDSSWYLLSIFVGLGHLCSVLG